MVRLIKRYGSRKLYDTEGSQYVSLDEIAEWIREGQQVRVIDNASSEDVTAQTLVQIISEQGRRGTTLLPEEFLHELIRAGGEVFSSGKEKLQRGMGRLLQASVDRLGPVRELRDETERLRARLEELETSLEELESSAAGTGSPDRAGERKRAKKKAAGTKAQKKTKKKAAGAKAQKKTKKKKESTTAKKKRRKKTKKQKRTTEKH